MVSAQSETGVPIVLSSCTGAYNPKLFTDSDIRKSKDPNLKLQPQINNPNSTDEFIWDDVSYSQFYQYTYSE